MKKILLIFLIILIFCLTGCESDECDFVVNAKFAFYKDGDKIMPFESNEFLINTKIYVCVDFDIKKNTDDVETISFVVQIPYAEYYSTKDFYSGTVIPHENPYEELDQFGNVYTVMELNQMNFVISDNEIHSFSYVFEIEANQICDFAEFKVRFKPENTNLTISVNGENDNKAITYYTFKDNED